MKTIIFTHADSDGICSGALALAANTDSPVFFTNPVSILPDLVEALGFDRVIVCDIAINIPTSAQLKERVDLLAEEAEVIYIDHHPLPDSFHADWLHSDLTASASELTYRYFRADLTPDMSRVALYGAIGDYRDDSSSIYEMVQDWDKRSLYYQAGTLSQGIEIGRRDYEFKRWLVSQLAQNVLPSEIEVLRRNAVVASRRENELRQKVMIDVIRMRHLSYVINQNACMSKAAIYSRVYGGTPVGMSAEYRDRRDSFDFSLRARGKLNLNKIVSQSTARFGGSGGGHPLAAGGRIPADRFREFLLDLDKSIGLAIEQSETKAPAEK